MRIFTLLGLVIFVFHVHHFHVHWTDDAFIFFRYAELAYQGSGLRWNSVEPPVEGFSSPLWLFFLILGKMLSLSPLVSSTVLGTMSLLGTLVLMGVWGKKEEINPLMAPLLYTCMGSAYYWGLSGMETAMYTVLFVASFSAFVFPSLSFCAALLAIARPEGPLLLLLWSVLWWYYQKEKITQIWMYWVPCLGYLVFRYWYFGDWLPNTYYAKAGASLLERVQLGMEYTFPVLMALACLAFAFRHTQSVLSRSLMLAAIVHTTIIIGGGGDWMNWGRLLQPVFPIILFLAVRQLQQKQWLGGCSLFSVLSFMTPLRGLVAIAAGETLPIVGFQEGGLHDISQDIATDIRANLPKGSTIAINHAGFIPFYLPEYHFVDMTGLNDAFIAHHTQGGLHQKYDSDYVLRKNPDLIILNALHVPSKEPFVLNYWEGETDLYQHPEFSTHYHVIDGYYERLRFGGGKAYVLLFQRTSNTD